MARLIVVVATIALTATAVRAQKDMSREGRDAKPKKPPPASAKDCPPVEIVPKCRKSKRQMKGDRSESWGEHFAIYERLPDLRKILLAGPVHVVDVNSDIIIVRESSTPELLHAVDTLRQDREENAEPQGQPSTDGKKECQSKVDEHQLQLEKENDQGARLSCAQLMNDGFDIDVMRKRPRAQGGTCLEPVLVRDLQTEAKFEEIELQEEPGCPARRAALNDPKRALRKGDTLLVSRVDLRHGDRLDFDLYGERIRDEEETVNCKTAKDNRSRTCEVERKTVWGSGKSLTILAIDFAKVEPYELVGRDKWRIPATRSRVDIASDVAIGFFDSPPPFAISVDFDDAPAAIRVDVEVVNSTGAAGTVKKTTNAGVPVLGDLHDGDTVNLRLSRNVVIDGKPVPVEFRRYSFRAMAVGFHYAPSGDYKADYATSSCLLISDADDIDDSPLGYAQTFAYSFYWRRRSPGFFDHFGAGFHFALLASDADEADTADVSVGIGGQLTFGHGILHLGGGWDPPRDRGYFLLGLSLGDLADFLSSAVK